MSGKNGSEDNGLPVRLDRAQAWQITEFLIDQITGWDGERPFRTSPPPDWRTLEHPPDLRPRRIFPHIGQRRANKVARAFSDAITRQGRAPALRLITLRLREDRPAPEALDDHLSRLSDAAGSASDDIRPRSKRPARAIPLLTAIHIRMSSVNKGHFDPHVHAVWELTDDNISSVRKFLEKRFGEVWIDSKPLRSPRNAAYYVALGVVDYLNLRNWPVEALQALWRLRRHKMVRMSGWASQGPGTIDQVEGDEDDDGWGSSTQASQTSWEARGQAASQVGGSVLPQVNDEPSAARKGATSAAVVGDWTSELFPMPKPYRSSQRKALSVSTVRTLSPDITDLRAYPTLGEMAAVAILVVEAEQRDFDRTYEEVLRAYHLDEQQLQEAVNRVEAYFHLGLFHPGSGRMPTQEAILWAQDMMNAVESVHHQVELGRGRLGASFTDSDRLPPHLRRQHSVPAAPSPEDDATKLSPRQPAPPDKPEDS